MSKFKIYLAGKMSNLSYEEMNGWREKAEDLFAFDDNVKTENPCDFYNFENKRPDFTYTESEIKNFDLYLVKNCNLVLVNLDHPNSIGTAIEIHMAHDEWKIPVIGFGTTENHPWIELSVDRKCASLEDAVDYIREFYLPNF